MQKLIFTNSIGNKIDLTSGNFGITNWEGLSNTDLNIQTQQVPFQDGGVFLDALLEQREISVTVAIKDNNNLELRYQLKRELISALNPKLGEGILIYTNDYLSKQIKAVPQIPTFENKNSNDAGTLKASVVFSCPSPYWEDFIDNDVIFRVGQNITLDNEGDVPAQMEIEFYGNAENPTLVNDTTKKKIAYNAVVSDPVLIDTRMGQKKVITEKMVFENDFWANTINSVVYAKQLRMFVAVGNNGIIIYSTDGISWKVAFSGFEPALSYTLTSTTLYKVFYSEEKGVFIACGSGGHILLSQDGINWHTPTTYGGTSDTLQGIAYSPDLDMFIISGQNTLRKSTDDGENWTLISNTGFDCFTYFESLHKFAGSSGGGTIKVSADGETWTDVSTSLTDKRPAKGLVYSTELGLYLLFGYSYIYSSPDFVTWTDTQYTPPSNKLLYDMIYISDLNLFVACGNGIWTSADGQNWNFQNMYGITVSALNSLVYSETLNKIIVVGSSVLISSGDSYNWEVLINTADYPMTVYSIAYSQKQKLYVAVGGHQRNQYSGNYYPLYSVDGEKWMLGEDDIRDSRCVIYVKKLDLFVSVGLSINISYDGINWTRVRNNSNTLFSIVYSERLNLFVAVGYRNTLLTSTDGINWTERDSGITGTNNLRGVSYCEKLNRFVVVGSSYISTSTDGINWTAVDYGVSFYSVTCSESLGIFVAGGSGGGTGVSYDGINWTFYNIPEHGSDISLDINALCYSAELNMFLGVGARIITSPNGIDWTIHSKNYPNCFYGCDYVNGKFFIGGSPSSIYHSNFLPAENKIQYISTDSDINLNLEQGINRLYLTKTSGDLLCRIRYRQKYIGV